MLSFIVPAFNEELELPATLAALHQAARSAGEPYEIVVADDSSTDRTAQIAWTAEARVVQVHCRQIAAARNAGARAAKGDVFFFVDADTRIAGQHVSDAVAALRDGYVGGSARIDFDGRIPLLARLFIWTFWHFYFGSNLGAGAFLFCRRADFEAVGGFDEQYFAGEEMYFSIALKKRGRFTILQKPILSSGRKLRLHSGIGLLKHCFSIALAGQRALRGRDKLDLWYDGKRESTPQVSGVKVD